jgi:hypothetical protein
MAKPATKGVTAMADERLINDMITMAAFLFNLEADKGYNWIYGGRTVGECIDIFCRMTHIERPVWESIVWPDMGNKITPRKDAS